jgi:hypothetical protein
VFAAVKAFVRLQTSFDRCGCERASGRASMVQMFAAL